jgi:hypothetical protein
MNHDSPFLYFLRQFPAWIPLLAITLIFAGLYFTTGDVTYREWTGLTLSALFTSLGMQRTNPQPAPSANTQSGDVIVTEKSESTTLEEIKPGDFESAIENLEEKK